MNGIERLQKRWIRDEALQKLDMEQARGVIDALSLAMYADAKASADETVAYDGLTGTLPFGWAEIAELTAHAEAAAREAAFLADHDAIQTAVTKAAERVPETVRDQVFGMIVAVLVSDREMAEQEATLLTAFAGAFGYETDHAHGIYNEIVDAMGLVEE